MEKILIVDDSQPDRELLNAILSSTSESYEIIESASGRGCLNVLKKTPVDLVLLDLQMDDLNGFETLEQIKSQKTDKKQFLPILLVSSFTGVDDRLRGLDMGASDFITKPLIAEEVIARVASQIRFKRQYDDALWVEQKTNEGIQTLYHELESKNKELEKLDQMKSDFVSTVSHELRTPLAISIEGLNLLLDGIPGPVNDKQKKILSSSHENLGRLNAIINELLDISKIEAGKVELKRKVTDLTSLVRKLVELYQDIALKKKISLLEQINEEEVLAFVDEDKIIQVLNNLINNAIKFTLEGGNIVVSLNVNKEKQAIVSVRDNGIGIDEEDMEKVFGKFEQFTRQEGPGIKGTGLGLAICKSLVELHGGQIWVHSKLGEGTTFYFSLDLYDPRKDYNKDE